MQLITELSPSRILGKDECYSSCSPLLTPVQKKKSAKVIRSSTSSLHLLYSNFRQSGKGFWWILQTPCDQKFWTHNPAAGTTAVTSQHLHCSPHGDCSLQAGKASVVRLSLPFLKALWYLKFCTQLPASVCSQPFQKVGFFCKMFERWQKEPLTHSVQQRCSALF